MADAKILEPYRNFKYLVSIDGFTSGGFSKVSGLKMTTEVFEYREGGENTTVHKLPGQTKFDPVSLELAAATEGIERKQGNLISLYDSLEDCVMEIEELKDELSTIVLTRTGTGVNSRDRWDTPEIKISGGKKGRLRKDRYSAIVIANMLARNIHRSADPVSYPVVGGFAQNIRGKETNEALYASGPDWFMKEMGSFSGQKVNRK